LFYRFGLNYLVPHAVPLLNRFVGGLDVMLSPMDDEDRASVALGGGVDIAAVAAAVTDAVTGAAANAPVFSSSSSGAAAGQASGLEQLAVYSLSAVDRDTCSFLFLVFSAQLTAVAGLAASRAAWRCRLTLPAAAILPPAAAVSLFLGCNGVVGGLYAGADPAAVLATLLFTVAYHLLGGLALQFLVPPY